MKQITDKKVSKKNSFRKMAMTMCMPVLVMRKIFNDTMDTYNKAMCMTMPYEFMSTSVSHLM